jgi:hypothetical protein
VRGQQRRYRRRVRTDHRSPISTATTGT